MLKLRTNGRCFGSKPASGRSEFRDPSYHSMKVPAVSPHPAARQREILSAQPPLVAWAEDIELNPGPCTPRPKPHPRTLVIVMSRWTGLAPWNSLFQVAFHLPSVYFPSYVRSYQRSPL